MTRDRLQEVLNRFPKQTIVVVGDVMLDHFLWGRVSRISPEAPVPVVEVTRESYFPGGAANVARNLRALGATVRIIGVVGEDDAGRKLRELLDEQEIETAGLTVDPSRPTSLKTRIVAHNQQVVRFDRENSAPIARATQDRLFHHFLQAVPQVKAVVFEDYAKGVFTQDLFGKMLELAFPKGIITAADPNSRRVLDYGKITAITPNRQEAFAAAGVPYAEPTDDVLSDEPLKVVGDLLLKKWAVQNLLVTLGEHGMCLFRPGHKPHHIPTVAQQVFDVSGAGDTVIATLALALAAGANPVEAAEISNHAAGVVVGKIGTATCSPDELTASFAQNCH
ncbi:MAG TPA: D-glycero-beta-D-manno-heptose-7-phosphate kinase [Verrucomicrobiae bacterium]|nr:D-glycero-beta-D-manno-heptose-7-phosphate kinase [Verrucomicrobiae bacterium]